MPGKKRTISSRTHVFSTALEYQVSRCGERKNMYRNAGKIMGVSEATVKRWCSGEAPAPRVPYECLRLTLDEKYRMNQQMTYRIKAPIWVGYMTRRCLTDYYKKAANDSEVVAYMDRDELA